MKFKKLKVKIGGGQVRERLVGEWKEDFKVHL